MTEDQTTACPDEDEIKLGFLGSDQERRDALERLWQHYSRRLMAFVEGRLPGLPSDLAANAVLDAFKELFAAVQRAEFDYDRRLFGFLCTVAHRRGVDELRKHRRRPVGNSDFYDSVADTLSGTDLSRDWQDIVKGDGARQVSEKFRAFMLTLPPVQRQVAQVMADAFPDALNREELCDQIHRRTGKRPTGIQVKSALSEIRRKFRELMKRK